MRVRKHSIRVRIFLALTAGMKETNYKPDSPPTLPELGKTRHKMKALPTNGKLYSLALYYFDQRIDGVRSYHTQRAKRLDLQKFLDFFYTRYPSGDTALWDLATSQAFEREVRKTHAISSVLRYLDNLSSFALYLENKQVFSHEDNPVRGITKPSQLALEPQRIQLVTGVHDTPSSADISPAQVFKEMVAMCKKKIAEKEALPPGSKKKKGYPYRDLAVLTTLYYTGLRVDELCGLTLQQRSRYKGGCFFREVQCKGNKTKKVFLVPEAYNYLQSYIKSNERAGNKSPYIFIGPRGDRLYQQAVWRILTDIARNTDPIINEKFAEQIRAASEGYVRIKVHPHSLRHELTYNLIESKEFPESFIAQNILGHTSTKYIARYANVSEKELAEKMTKAHRTR